MKISTYILKRVIQIIPMLIAVTVFAFALTNLSGGDPAEIAVRNTGAQVTPENVEAMRIELGLDKPLIVQYLLWLKGAFMLDFGNSYVSGKPALEEIMTRFPNTLFLVLVASIIAIGVAIPLALIAARRPNGIVDHIIRVITIIGVSMPEFWIGLLLLYLFSVNLGVAPVIAGSNYAYVWLPAITMSIGYSCIYIRMLRANLIEVSNSLYIKAARAKGMTKGTALIRHGLRNSILPCLTLVATNFGGMISGSFAVESIFTWNGVAGYAINSVKSKDFAVIQCYLMIIALAYIIINLTVDIIYMFVDPKIRLQRDTGRKAWKAMTFASGKKKKNVTAKNPFPNGTGDVGIPGTAENAAGENMGGKHEKE